MATRPVPTRWGSILAERWALSITSLPVPRYAVLHFFVRKKETLEREKKKLTHTHRPHHTHTPGTHKHPGSNNCGFPSAVTTLTLFKKMPFFFSFFFGCGAIDFSAIGEEVMHSSTTRSTTGPMLPTLASMTRPTPMSSHSISQSGCVA